MNARPLTRMVPGILCLLAISLGPAACHRSPAPAPAAAARRPGDGQAIVFPPSSPLLKQVHAETVATATVSSDEIVAPGRIMLDPRRVSRVVPPVPGRVQRVAVQLGDVVHAGQPLLIMESPEAEAALAEARHADAEVSQAAATLRRAQADLDRLKDLWEHKAAARKDALRAEEDLVRAQSADAQARASASQAHRRTEILGLETEGGGPLMVVRAPIGGKVLEVTVTAGEYRTDTTGPAITIADLSSVLVSSEVAERDIRLVEVGERVNVELVAFPGRQFEGRVSRISDTVDPRTRTIQVQAEIANPSGDLRAEMYGRIRHSHRARSVAVVPAQAVVQSADGPFVYIEHATGSFRRARIVAGENHDGRVAVLEGVQAGDRVVVEGVMLLHAQDEGDLR